MTNDPFAVAQRRRLVLRPGKERVVSNRHPWIFEGAVARESGPAEAAIADLVDGEGHTIASGFHSRTSQIRLRALTFGDEELSADLLRARIRRAIAARAPLLTERTNACRLVHAEGDDLSGLVVDRYGEMVVVEIANRGLEQLKPLIIEILQAELQPRLIWFKNDLPARKLEQLPLESDASAEGAPGTEIREDGLRFRVDSASGQKTGFFLDQRENRLVIRELSLRRRVLNLFAYTGAFGVYAAAGGASEVENVDISAPAIDVARENHELNGYPATFTVADAFGYVRGQAAAGTRYDIVVCDPPAFAKSRRDIERAARGYKDINLYALRLVEGGGFLMTFSCSGHMSLDLFQKVIFSAAHDANRRVAIVRRLTAGADHPVSLYCPEGEYLKGFLLRVE